MHYAPPNVKTITDLAHFGDSYIQPGDSVFVRNENDNFMYVPTAPTTPTDGVNVIKAARLSGFWLRQGAGKTSTSGILALGNFASGGSVGTAPSTVDVAPAISINQTTGGQTLTLPSPTAGGVHEVAVFNVGTQSFTLLGVTVAAGAGILAAWNGSAWTSI